MGTDHRVWMRRAVPWCAAVAAGLLLLAYVQVCREAVARGDRWQAEQRLAAEPRVALRPAGGRS